jgi:hypothetical protein
MFKESLTEYVLVQISVQTVLTVGGALKAPVERSWAADRAKEVDKLE